LEEKYAGMLPPEMKKLKQLEDENARLKKIVADLTLDREMHRTSFAESSKASQAGGGEGHVPRLGDLDPACLWGAELRSFKLPLHLSPCRSGRLERRIREICET
jgi:hypothetical protein